MSFIFSRGHSPCTNRCEVAIELLRGVVYLCANCNYCIVEFGLKSGWVVERFSIVVNPATRNKVTTN